MEQKEKTEIHQCIQQLAETTRQGKVQWTKANPTTFMWSPQQSVRVVLQLIEQRIGPRSVRYYLFQAVDNTGPKLTLNGSQDSETNTKLDDLYQAIESYISRQGIDFLKSIIPSK